MAIKEFKMPHLGESVTEASISQWMVEEGDKVERFDPIAEAVSDKVTTEIPSDFSGVIKEILIETDTDVPIGTPILKIDTAGDGSEGGEEASEEPQQAEKAPAEDQGQESAAPQQSISSAQTSVDGKRFSPAVRKIASEKGIDLSQVEGSGKHGRITRRDVENFDPQTQAASADTGKASVDQAVVSADQSGAAAATDQNMAQAQSQPVQAQAPASAPSQGQPKQSTQPASYANADVVKATPVRKKIAEKMSQSKTEIPHAWMMVEADVTNIVNLRNQAKESFLETEGVKLSYFPFFVKAVTQAIKKHPIVNTSWDNGHIVYHQDINTSIAVGTDDALFVPVIRNADQYSISGIAKEINRLSEGARTNSLSPDDMQGGTITVNNTGVFGSVQSMGIINHPQAAILQVESINKRVVADENGGMKFAHMVNLCLSMDHRILDGVAAGKFLNQVKENLANFHKEADIY